MIDSNTDRDPHLDPAPAGAAATPFDLVEDEFSPPPAEGEAVETKVTHEVIEMELREEPAPEPATSDEDGEEFDPDDEKGGWVVSLLCAGVALVAVCLLLPLAEENHQLAYQKEKLKADLEQIKKQVAVNGEFLKKVSGDPTLAERLAQRQMKFIREGTGILDLPDESGKEEMSPFLLVSLPPPNPMPAYQPLGGMLAGVVRNPRLRLYVTGLGLLLLAAGVVLGGGNKQTYDTAASD
jgi:hypothetical protein